MAIPLFFDVHIDRVKVEGNAMTLTLNVADAEVRRLAEKAQAAGIDVQTYVERLVSAVATAPPLVEVLRPVRDAFRESGMSEEALGKLLEDAKHQLRRDRRSGQCE